MRRLVRGALSIDSRGGAHDRHSRWCRALCALRPTCALRVASEIAGRALALDPGRAAASSYAGTDGVPAVLPRAWFEGLMGLAGDRGARDLLRTRAHDVNVIEFLGLANDVDRPTDLARLRSR